MLRYTIYRFINIDKAVEEYQSKIDFQDGCRGGHLDYRGGHLDYRISNSLA